MDNTTIIKFQIELAAQQIISQVMINNEQISQQLKSGVEAAVKEFDFEAEVKAICLRTIKAAIERSSNYGAIQKLIEAKSEEIMKKYVEDEMQYFKDKMKYK